MYLYPSDEYNANVEQHCSHQWLRSPRHVRPQHSNCIGRAALLYITTDTNTTLTNTASPFSSHNAYEKAQSLRCFNGLGASFH